MHISSFISRPAAAILLSLAAGFSLSACGSISTSGQASSTVTQTEVVIVDEDSGTTETTRVSTTDPDLEQYLLATEGNEAVAKAMRDRVAPAEFSTFPDTRSTRYDSSIVSEFHSPSTKLWCTVDGNEERTRLACNNDSILPSPGKAVDPSVPFEFSGFYFTSSEGIEPGFGTNLQVTGNTITFPYGTTWGLGDLYCYMSTMGLSCWNTSTKQAIFYNTNGLSFTGKPADQQYRFTKQEAGVGTIEYIVSPDRSMYCSASNVNFFNPEGDFRCQSFRGDMSGLMQTDRLDDNFNRVTVPANLVFLERHRVYPMQKFSAGYSAEPTHIEESAVMVPGRKYYFAHVSCTFEEATNRIDCHRTDTGVGLKFGIGNSEVYQTDPETYNPSVANENNG
ncbi:MAG: hypothetical protein Q3972_05985 [Corynebacterium sp.]|nr:hypothetical protein [Corynebacterium sp.]